VARSSPPPLLTITPARRTERSMGRKNKAEAFRDGTYVRFVSFGKRTVKQGECAAVWSASGKRKVVEGPQRIRLWWSHVRFLSRTVADGHQYLVIQYRNGSREHRRGPCAMFHDPCIHEFVGCSDAYKLAANEALVVYREAENKEDGIADQTEAIKAAAAATGPTVAVAVGRQIVRGPAVFVPRHDEWVHTFSWHGTPSAGKLPGQGSKTGKPNDDKVPHATKFQVLRQMPDQMYCTVRDVRTKDDAQVAVHLMIFYELDHIEQMLDSTNDPIGDFINATSADVMSFGAANTYESLLERTEQLSELATFPTVKARMETSGYRLINVVYRGYSTSSKLQEMHDDAIARRTKLRLQSATARVEQAEQSMLLRAREERAEGERALEAAAARHSLEIGRLEAEQRRKEADADHGQHMRHQAEAAEATLKIRQHETDEEVRRAGALKHLGVDLTKLLCVSADGKPTQHVRIDSATPTQVHLDVAR